jgi:hypothetical protein
VEARTLDDIATDPQPGDCFQVQNGHRFEVTGVDADSVQATETRGDGTTVQRDIPKQHAVEQATWGWVVNFFQQYDGTVC